MRLAASEEAFPGTVVEGPGPAVVDLHGFDLPVPGDVHDLQEVGAVGERRGDEAGPQRVAGEQRGIEPGRGRAGLHDLRGGTVRQRGRADPSEPVDRAEQRAGGDLSGLEPGVERGDPFRPGTAKLPATMVERYRRAREILVDAISRSLWGIDTAGARDG